MTSPDPDRLRYAQIAGAVARHALGWRLTADEEAMAVAELAEAAAGRADLLAERAGTALGFGEGRPDAARYRQIAELCVAAGADPALIERWIEVGRERAATAAAIPYTGPPPGGLLAPAVGLVSRRSRRAWRRSRQRPPCHRRRCTPGWCSQVADTAPRAARQILAGMNAATADGALAFSGWPAASGAALRERHSQAAWTGQVRESQPGLEFLHSPVSDCPLSP